MSNTRQMEHQWSHESYCGYGRDIQMPWDGASEEYTACACNDFKPYSMPLKVPQVVSGRNTPLSRSDKYSNASTYRSSSPSSTMATDETEMRPEPCVGDLHTSLPCVFFFMNCTYQSDDPSDWKAHCTEHFTQQGGPPDIVDCFLCEEASTAGSRMAWDLMLDHAASCHRENPQVLRPVSPNSIIAILIQRGLVKPDDLPGMLDADHRNTSIDRLQDAGHPDNKGPPAGAENGHAHDDGFEAADASVDATHGNAFELEANCSDDDSESDDEEELFEIERQPDMFYIVKCLLKMDLQPVLEEREKQIIQHIMGELHYVIPGSPSSTRSHTNSTGSSGTPGKATSHPKNRRASGSGAPIGGPLEDDDGENDNNTDDGEEERERPPKPHSGSNSLMSSKFACPFFKRDPAKYQNFAGCPGPGWMSVHRLKAHIYSKHIRPEQCARCWETFGAPEEYVRHVRLTEQCELRAEAKADGIDAGQCAALRSKKRTKGVTSEADKWNRIYSIIFPNDTEIPSPYYEPSEARNFTPGSDYFAGFEEFQKDEYFQRLMTRVQEIVRKDKTSVAEQFIPEILEVVRETNAGVARDYQKTGSTAAQSALTTNSSDEVVSMSTAGQGNAPAILDQPASAAADEFSAMYDMPPISSSRPEQAILQASTVPHESVFSPTSAATETRMVAYDAMGDGSASVGSTLGSRYLYDSRTSRLLTASSMTDCLDVELNSEGNAFLHRQENAIQRPWSDLQMLNQPNPTPEEFKVSQLNPSHQPPQQQFMFLQPEGSTGQASWPGCSLNSETQPGQPTIFFSTISETPIMVNCGPANSNFSHSHPSYSNPYVSGTMNTGWAAPFIGATALPTQTEQDNAAQDNQDEAEFARPRKRRHQN